MIPTTSKARIVAGGAALIVGVWLFLFPFVASSAGMPLYAASSGSAAKSSSMSGMSGSKNSSSMSGMSGNKNSSSMSGMSGSKNSSSMSGMSGSKNSSSMSGMKNGGTSSGSSGGSSSSGVVLDHATVVASLIPGILIAVLGVYLLAGAFDRRQQAMALK